MGGREREKLDLEALDNHVQVVRERSSRSFLRRWARVLIVLLVAYYLYIWHLHKGAFGPNGRRRRHRQRPSFGRLAEKAFLSVPDTESAIKASRQYAGQPHVAGSDGDFKTAEMFLSHLQQSFGIQPPKNKPIFDAGSHESQEATRGMIKRRAPSAWIDTYYPVMNTPLERALQILDEDDKVIWEADLKEHAPEGDDKDQDAVKYADAVPTFHGLSISGDVVGHLVDGNYCTKEDYDKLVASDAPLKGSIVLCRYGAIFRGLKVKGGQENGATGVLIYSDPRDDGSVTVENGYAAYPDGPARNPTSVQRGSVQFLSIYPGDPTTPGYPSYKNSTRMEGTNIPSIPSLPISWRNAQRLLEHLESGDAAKGRRIRLSNNVDTRVIPIWNVIGVIPGYIKNEVVVAGNHRDAWVLGAVDPSSGTVSVHEVIRGFGRLMKKGWKPLRTIVIASWDAEEYGLIGSTEWGEDFADWIDRHVVAYFNLDSSVSGSRFGAQGSPLLAHFIRGTAQDVPHPTEKNKTLWDATGDTGSLPHPSSGGNDANAVRVAQTEIEVAISMADDLGVSPLGSGSDYTVFLQRNGVPSTNEGFSSTLDDPVYHYHSVYDSEHWQENYGDPGFSRHIAIAQHLGLQILRFANAPLLPLNVTHYSLQLESYLDTVEQLPETQALDVNLKSLRSSMHRLQRASRHLDRERHKAWGELRNALRKWWRHHKRHHHRHHCDRHHHPHRHYGKFGAVRRLLVRIKALVLGHRVQEEYPKGVESFQEGGPIQDFMSDHPLAAFYAAFEFSSELEALVDIGFDFEPGLGCRPRFLCRAIMRAIHHIYSVNLKLRSFERGLISKGGIKDREWFRHLGVAPGKWLGYGATTLPGLTEAIVFDNDKDAAEHEVKRLEALIMKMVKKLEAQR